MIHQDRLPESQVPKHNVPWIKPTSILFGISAISLGVNLGLGLAHNLEEREQLVAAAAQSGTTPNEETMQQINRSIVIETVGLGLNVAALGFIAVGVSRRKFIKGVLRTSEGHETLTEALPQLKESDMSIKQQLYKEDNPMFRGKPLRDDIEAEDGRFDLLVVYNRALRRAGFDVTPRSEPDQPSAKMVGLLAITVDLLNHSINLDHDKKISESYYERSKASYDMTLALLNEFVPLVGDGDNQQSWGDYIASLRQDKSHARLLRDVDYAIRSAK